MGRKILTMSLVLVTVLFFTACAEEAEEELGLPSTQEIVDGVIESLESIRTYQFDMDMTMDMAGEVEGEAFKMIMTLDSGGAFDLENSQMRMDMAISMAMIGEEVEMGLDMYLIGDMVYMLMDAPETGPMWMKSEMPEGIWEEMGQVEPQLELLETAQVKFIGSERVRGIDSYILQLTPDMEQLWQLAVQQAAVAGGEMPTITEGFLQEIFRSFSVKQWVAKDTYFLTKAEIDMAMELTPEAMGFPEEEGILTMDIAISLLAYNYNQPVSIVLPPEAEEAVEVPQE